MKKSRFSEYKIIKILKKAEVPAKGVCREYGISKIQHYSCGMEASEIRRKRELGCENTRLK